MKRLLSYGLLVTALASGCDGGGVIEDAGTDGANGGDCTAQEDGTACGAGSICLAGVCEASQCGDSFVDSAAGEQCDDGNQEAWDGCQPGTCTFTCMDDSGCNDGALCNGTETCDMVRHVCASGTEATDRTPCGDARVCLDGACVPAGCGNSGVETGEECDDGRNGNDLDGCTDRCTFTCTLWPSATNVLGAVNGGFEAGSSYSVTAPEGGGPNPPGGAWFGDRASIVTAESGIAPFAASARMLRFEATSPTGGSSSAVAQARYALVIPPPWDAMVASGLVRAHLSAHVDRVSTVGADTQFDVALFAYDAHPSAGGTELATALGTIRSDVLLDSWECVRAGLRIPVGTTILYAEVSAVEDLQNDTSDSELAGHFADEVALWFSVDPCVEGEACIPNGDRCALGARSCAGGGNVCEPVGTAPDGTLCDVGFACVVGGCAPNATIDSAVNLSVNAVVSGRTCAAGAAYSVVSIAGSTIGLSDSPAAGCIGAGDEVLLINLQGSPSMVENIGRWELLRVSSVSGSEVTTQSAPLNHYGESATMNDNIGVGDGQQRVALVRVPSFGHVTIGASGSLTGAGWNGVLGSIVALRAASLDVRGRINARSIGYRSGAWSQDDGNCSDSLLTGAGESIGGDPGPTLLASYGGPGGIGGVFGSSFWSNNPLPASAGHSSAGQPGANGGARELGPPGMIYGVSDGTRLTMGSGGAGGVSCDTNPGPNLSPSGTQSGGIVLLLVDTLRVDSAGEITASATGSGASGGYVLIRGSTLEVGEGRVTARGGMGVAGSFTNMGSDGYIVLDASTSITGSTVPIATMP